MAHRRLTAAAIAVLGSSLMAVYSTSDEPTGIAVTVAFLAGTGLAFTGLIGVLQPDATFLGLESTSADVPAWLVVVILDVGVAIWILSLL